ncbi:hypothetical protein WCE10_21465, partial [Cronobacter muytjensii]|uniref:hypothetical protein n=1 Tax=Cronobacter muytjensii TaxID=413501 RepID=UPI0034D692B7
TMQGAAVGGPGTLPTNWAEVGNHGLSRQVVGTGTEDGIEYIDIRFYGTVAATPQPEVTINFDSGTATAGAGGQKWVSSAFVRVVGGSLANVTSGEQFILGFKGTSMTEANSRAFSFSSSALKLNRQVHEYTLKNAETVSLLSRVDINFASFGGVPV